MISFKDSKQWNDFRSNYLASVIFNQWYEYIKKNSHYKHVKHAFNSLCKHNNGFNIKTVELNSDIYYKFTPNIKEDKKPITHIFDEDYNLIAIISYDKKCIYSTKKINKEIINGD